MVINAFTAPASALTVTLDAPNEVRIQQEFEATIRAETTGIYDVKIFVHDGNPRNIISQVFFNESWRNPFYYLKSAFPDQQTFLVHVTSFSGAGVICARLRLSNSSSSTYSEACRPITIQANGSEAIEPPVNNNSHRAEDERNTTKEPLSETPSIPFREELENPVAPSSTPQKIVLKSSSASTQAPVAASPTYFSREGQVQQTVIYVFAGFCVILAGLIALRRV